MKNNVMEFKYFTKKSKRWLATVLLMLAGQNGFADEQLEKPFELPKQVTIQQLLQVVREKSPRFALARSRLEDAKAGVIAADVLPNPNIAYGRYDLASATNTMYNGHVQQQVTVSVPILASGQHGARVEAAERKVEVTEASIEVEYMQLLRDTWRLFSRLLATQEKLTVLETAHQESQKLQHIVTEKEQAGMASPYDTLRLTQESLTLGSRLETARTDKASIVGELGVLLGLPTWKVEALGKLEPMGTPTDIEKLWLQTETNNPELETARREIIAADADVEKAKAERWPVPSVQFGTVFTGNPYGMTTFAGLTVDMPIFDRGQGGMAKAEAEKHAALLKRNLMTVATRQELERAVEVLKQRRENLRKFEQEVLKSLPDLKQMAEDAYQLGQTGLLEVLDASRSRTEIKLTHLNLLSDEIDAELDTLMASGLLANSFESSDKQRLAP